MSANQNPDLNSEPDRFNSLSVLSVRPDWAHFVVQAAADPATLSRVIEYFAHNNILPETVKCRRYVGGDLMIDVKVRDMDENRAAIILGKLQASVLVFSASIEWFHASQAENTLRVA